VATPIEIIQDDPLFKGLGTSFEVGRYHSWVVQSPLPESLVLLAKESNNQVMAMRHKTYDLYGVQFHPESILSPTGKQMLNNWINM
jgi:anthranilate synthase component 2